MRNAATEIAECAFVMAMEIYDLTHPDTTAQDAARWADELMMHYFGCDGITSLDQFDVRELRRRAKLMMQDLTDRL